MIIFQTNRQGMLDCIRLLIDFLEHIMLKATFVAVGNAGIQLVHRTADDFTLMINYYAVTSQAYHIAFFQINKTVGDGQQSQLV